MGLLHHMEKVNFGSFFITQKTRPLSLASNKKFLIGLALFMYPVLDQSLWLGNVWLGLLLGHMLLHRYSHAWLSLMIQVSTPVSLLQSSTGSLHLPVFFLTLITFRNYIIYLLLCVLIVCLFQLHIGRELVFNKYLLEK